MTGVERLEGLRQVRTGTVLLSALSPSLCLRAEGAFRCTAWDWGPGEVTSAPGAHQHGSLVKAGERHAQILMQGMLSARRPVLVLATTTLPAALLPHAVLSAFAARASPPSAPPPPLPSRTDAQRPAPAIVAAAPLPAAPQPALPMSHRNPPTEPSAVTGATTAPSAPAAAGRRAVDVAGLANPRSPPLPKAARRSAAAAQRPSPTRAWFARRRPGRDGRQAWRRCSGRRGRRRGARCSRRCGALWRPRFCRRRQRGLPWRARRRTAAWPWSHWRRAGRRRGQPEGRARAGRARRTLPGRERRRSHLRSRCATACSFVGRQQRAWPPARQNPNHAARERKRAVVRLPVGPAGAEQSSFCAPCTLARCACRRSCRRWRGGCCRSSRAASSSRCPRRPPPARRPARCTSCWPSPPQVRRPALSPIRPARPHAPCLPRHSSPSCPLAAGRFRIDPVGVAQRVWRASLHAGHAAGAPPADPARGGPPPPPPAWAVRWKAFRAAALSHLAAQRARALVEAGLGSDPLTAARPPGRPAHEEEEPEAGGALAGVPPSPPIRCGPGGRRCFSEPQRAVRRAGLGGGATACLGYGTGGSEVGAQAVAQGARTAAP